MPKHESDYELLCRMRTELDRYLNDRIRLDTLLRNVSKGQRALQECEPEIIEEMRQELRRMREISTAARKAGRVPPLPRHLHALEESVTILSRLLWQGMMDAGDEISEEDVEYFEDEFGFWGY